MSLSKEDKINQEITRLKEILHDLSDSKKSIAEGLMAEAAFMRATLDELKADINKNGAVDEMNQGSYTIMRESPAVKTYNTMVQRFNTTCKELFNLLPKGQENDPLEDGFEEFLNRRS